MLIKTNIYHYLIITNLFFSIHSFSQTLPINTQFHFSDSTQSTIYLSTQYVTQSNSLSQSFINAVKSSNYLSSKVKDSNPYHNPFSALYEWLTEVNYYTQPDSLFGTEQLGIHARIAYHQLFQLSTQAELIKLLLYGNKPFAGKKIAFSQSQFHYHNYATTSLGFYKNYEFDRIKLKAIFDINIHIFKEIQTVNINNGNIFTSEDGDYIDVSLKGTYQSSRSYNPGLSFNMGLELTHTSSQTCFAFQTSQLGFVRLNSASNYARIDTTLHFQGIEIQNILTYPTLSSGLLSNDSLTKYYQSFIDTTFSYSRIPEIIHLSYSKTWKHFRWAKLSAGIIYFTGFKKQFPMFYIMESMKVKKHFVVATGVQFLGFGFIHPYFIGEYNKNQWSVIMYLSDPFSYIFSKYPANTSLNIGIKRKW